MNDQIPRTSFFCKLAGSGTDVLATAAVALKMKSSLLFVVLVGVITISCNRGVERRAFNVLATHDHTTPAISEACLKSAVSERYSNVTSSEAPVPGAAFPALYIATRTPFARGEESSVAIAVLGTTEGSQVLNFSADWVGHQPAVPERRTLGQELNSLARTIESRCLPDGVRSQLQCAKGFPTDESCPLF